MQALVLVAVASKHGSTHEIGEAIAATLRRAGLAVEVSEVEGITAIDQYDAVILGSAVYMGRWLGEARDFAEANRAALQRKPVWLFSSGPIGDPPKPDEESPDMTELAGQLPARDARTFPGELDPSELSFRDKLVTKAFRAQPGDYRPWAEIESWATDIAATLQSTRPESPRDR